LGIIDPYRTFPTTSTGAPPEQTQETVNDGIDHFREYLLAQGITPAALQAHPYTLLMDLNFDYYEVSGAAGVTIVDSVVKSTSEELTEDLGTPITPTIVRPRFQVDDIDSQRYFGSIELDDDGNPTDGIHERVIDGSMYEGSEAIIAAANADLNQFAWPIVTTLYSIRGPEAHKHKPGRQVPFNLTKPPIKGTFAIQEVRIDQILDEHSNVLSPRYNVTASSIKFDMNDLLSMIAKPSKAPAMGAISIGANPRTIAKAAEQARGESKQAIAIVSRDVETLGNSVDLPLALYPWFGSVAAIGNNGSAASTLLGNLGINWGNYISSGTATITLVTRAAAAYVQSTMSIASTSLLAQGWLILGADKAYSMKHGCIFDIYFATGIPSAAGADMKIRYWIGLFGSTSVTLTSGTLTERDTIPTSAYAAMRFSQTVPDVNWQYIVRDGSAIKTVDSGLVYTQDVESHLRIRVSGTTVYFSLNGGAEVAVTENVPPPDTMFFPGIFVTKEATGLTNTTAIQFQRFSYRVGQ
jgi:hypothetical protein